MAVKSKLKRIDEKWDAMDKWLKRLISFGASIATIAGVCAGAVTWALSQLGTVIDARMETTIAEVESIRQGVDENKRNIDLSTTRLELLSLIAHNADNVLEIEKVAYHYFVELGGDWYMSQIYTDWATAYNADITFVAHKAQ